MISSTFNAADIKTWAAELGFDLCAITPARTTRETQQALAAFVRQGYHGDMDWMQGTLERRLDPAAMWPDAKNAIMLAANYGPNHNPLDDLTRKEHATISVYARNKDYHDVLKRRLKRLARCIADESDAKVKVFVDTAPVMEKPLAQAAGLGWQGKHTNLVSRTHGSWLFLGCILTDADVPADIPEIDHCGACTSCLDICPTNAFPSPYQLDARRCISYLTIEFKGHIPAPFRKPMGNRIYGCDDCLAVCPWNKFAQNASEAAFHPRPELTAPLLADLLGLDNAAFREVFAGSPIKRIGRDRFIRNVLIASGNSEAPALLPAVLPHLNDPAAIVRAMAAWAVRQLAERPKEVLEQALSGETDPDVRREAFG